MLCNIITGDTTFELADGTLAGGFALSDLRIRMDRNFELVLPLESTDPELLDRPQRKTVITFNVTRAHNSIGDAEAYITAHEDLLPQQGLAKFITGNGGVYYSLASEIVSHQLGRELGKTTMHTYEIIGGPLYGRPGFYRGLEAGGYRLLESGAKRELEHF